MSDLEASAPADRWSAYPWPEWVPIRLRDMISRDYLCRHEGPERWEDRGPVPLGRVVQIDDVGRVIDGKIPNAVPVFEGRFLFCWGNMCRVVKSDSDVKVAFF